MALLRSRVSLPPPRMTLSPLPQKPGCHSAAPGTRGPDGPAGASGLICRLPLPLPARSGPGWPQGAALMGPVSSPHQGPRRGLGSPGDDTGHVRAGGPLPWSRSCEGPPARQIKAGPGLSPEPSSSSGLRRGDRSLVVGNLLPPTSRYLGPRQEGPPSGHRPEVSVDTDGRWSALFSISVNMGVEGRGASRKRQLSLGQQSFLGTGDPNHSKSRCWRAEGGCRSLLEGAGPVQGALCRQAPLGARNIPASRHPHCRVTAVPLALSCLASCSVLR